MAHPPIDRRDDTTTLLPLDQYDVIICSYSGGKDSLACVLHLLELFGETPESRAAHQDPSRLRENRKLQLWHQAIDGLTHWTPAAPGYADYAGLMDWPMTHGYVEATGQALHLPVFWQYKVGGFRGELLRENSLTQPIRFQQQDGDWAEVGGKRGKLSTRRRFPQVSADLRVRWCSAYLKIDVCAAAIRNEPTFSDANILMVTGERSEESPGRAKYAHAERLARASNRRRRVDQWRPIQDWTEQEVWQLIERWRVRPHPAYVYGWGRVSCQFCIFGNADQWASARELDPERFEAIVELEREFDHTIHRTKSVVELADEGTPYEYMQQPYVLHPRTTGYSVEEFFVPPTEEWSLPAGAYRRCGGPT